MKQLTFKIDESLLLYYLLASLLAALTRLSHETFRPVFFAVLNAFIQM
jgi:hypothetical protein